MHGFLKRGKGSGNFGEANQDFKKWGRGRISLKSSALISFEFRFDLNPESYSSPDMLRLVEENVTKAITLDKQVNTYYFAVAVYQCTINNGSWGGGWLKNGERFDRNTPVTSCHLFNCFLSLVMDCERFTKIMAFFILPLFDLVVDRYKRGCLGF